jgi:DNA polymerase III epsilon subunit-like protein
LDFVDRLAFIDLETTGLDAKTEEIIEVGVCFVERGTVAARRSWLFKPGRPLPALITALTGLTDDELAGAPAFLSRREEVRAALAGWTLVAHNASFEKSFLGPLVDGAAFVDSCEVMHLLYPELPSHALDALVRWAGVGEGARHRALDDAEDTWLVLRAAFQRFAASGRREELERLVRRLSPPESPDLCALVQLLAGLSTRCAGTPPAPLRAPRRLVDEALVGRFVASLGQARPGAVDVERGVLDAALEAARRVGASAGAAVTVAVPRELVHEAAAQATWVPREQVCSTRLAQLLDTPAHGDAARLARGWLEVWAGRSRDGDVATHSGWMAARLPETRALLEQARGCTCHAPGCFVRRTERESDRANVLVVSHELALDWLERGAPMTLLALGAERLPEAERRRADVFLDARQLQLLARGLDAGSPLKGQLLQAGQWLEHALGDDLAVDRRTRLWLELRDVLLCLQKDLARALAGEALAHRALRALADDVAKLLAPPGAGVELKVRRKALTLRLADPAATLARRLRSTDGRGLLLVAGTRGGTRWAGLPAPWVPPEVAPCSVETIAAPVSLAQAARLAVRLSHDTVLSCFSWLRVEALAAPFARLPDARYRLVEAARSLRGPGVLLGRWAGRPPPTQNVLLYDLQNWREAVIACGARHLTLASAEGISDAVSAELADVVAAASVRRVVSAP